MFKKMRLNNYLRRFPYVMYIPQKNSFRGYFSLKDMALDYDALHKTGSFPGCRFFEKGVEMK